MCHCKGDIDLWAQNQWIVQIWPMISHEEWMSEKPLHPNPIFECIQSNTKQWTCNLKKNTELCTIYKRIFDFNILQWNFAYISETYVKLEAFNDTIWYNLQIKILLQLFVLNSIPASVVDNQHWVSFSLEIQNFTILQLMAFSTQFEMTNLVSNSGWPTFQKE